MASKPIYQIYAELQDYEPKIWRRFQVMNDITMARLNDTFWDERKSFILIWSRWIE